MKILLKLILLVILTTVCYSQGKIVSIQTITRDFGEVTTEVVMSVAEFNQLINQSRQNAYLNEIRPERGYRSGSVAESGNTVGLKLVGGKLVLENNSQTPMRSISPFSGSTATLQKDQFKHFNISMINALNQLGGQPEIKIQNRNGELVLTNGKNSYNYVGHVQSNGS